MAVNSESCVGGGRWEERGVSGELGDSQRLGAREDARLWLIFTSAAPGSSEWRVTRTSDGEKTPERREEHGDQVRLMEEMEGAGDGVADGRKLAGQALSRSHASERMDSRDDDTGEVSKSTEVAALSVPSSSVSNSDSFSKWNPLSGDVPLHSELKEKFSCLLILSSMVVRTEAGLELLVR